LGLALEAVYSGLQIFDNWRFFFDFVADDGARVGIDLEGCVAAGTLYLEEGGVEGSRHIGMVTQAFPLKRSRSGVRS
jgi:hypothetical protein